MSPIFLPKTSSSNHFTASCLTNFRIFTLRVTSHPLGSALLGMSKGSWSTVLGLRSIVFIQPGHINFPGLKGTVHG